MGEGLLMGMIGAPLGVVPGICPAAGRPAASNRPRAHINFVKLALKITNPSSDFVVSATGPNLDSMQQTFCDEDASY
jgi:hypothetical protein